MGDWDCVMNSKLKTKMRELNGGVIQREEGRGRHRMNDENFIY